MTELCESVAVGLVGDADAKCPFCERKGAIPLRNLKTKHGALGKARRLCGNPNSAFDSDVGSEIASPLLPTLGGGKRHSGCVVKEGIFTDVAV
jgi:hypothetical protein